ncbi:MAG TPA: hypothetical protein VMT63_09595 [Bacteroidales bacterium]|nr:hypothetical protein [Bacteroidales bacterium]
MKNISKRTIINGLIFILLSSANGFGQDSSRTVRYTNDFRFKDGIYLNFDQVKENAPIPKARILTSADYNDRDFFTKIMASEKIYYYDDMGMRQEVEKSNIWGFSRNGVIYVMIQSTPCRITFIGSICHFVADVTTSYNNNYNYYSPYGYYDPYYSPYSYYGGYPYGSYYSPTRSSRTELKQYIFDFESGKVVDFTVENVKLLIMKDPSIYDEYVQLPAKRKKELMIVYIRKFNEKNPLYLPVK